MGDMENFVGKWEVTGTENMEEMLKVFDMEESKRSMYSDMKFTLEYIHKNGGDWSYTVHMPNGASKTYSFTIGKEFDSTTLDGRPIKSCINIEDGKFVEQLQDKEDSTLKAVMVREVVDNQLIVTAKVKDVTSITRHKKV